MQSIHDYDIYIFDCDGVILDSNNLKIAAMRNALRAISCSETEINCCIDYFSSNFGRSRFHHVDVFINNFLNIDSCDLKLVKDHILSSYSNQCRKLYFSAEITPGFLNFIKSIKGNKYIASGSEQTELRDVFAARSLGKYFTDIFGSPTKKSDLIAKILLKEANNNAIMFGDAISDFESSSLNNIDFIGYLPYSKVQAQLEATCRKSGSRVVESWSQINEVVQ